MKRSLVLCYTCLANPSQLPRLPPRLHDLAGLIPDKANVIADIGTDHGLLAYWVAQSRPRSKVIGIDASSAALEQGAYTLPKIPNLEFRLGQGLEGLQATDLVDVVCMAGIGVNTMTEILSPSKLLALNCQTIVLQPTGSRPRLCALLYKHLSTAHWSLESESILYNSRRWYLTSLWHRNRTGEAIVGDNDTTSAILPGLRLHPSQDVVAKRWSLHHCNWITSDWNAGSQPSPWMEYFCHDV
jgi:tRNA A22 N-methylase